VIGSARKEVKDCCLALDGITVIAMPYLKERDLMEQNLALPLEKKRDHLKMAMAQQYAKAFDYVLKQGLFDVPVVAMCHLTMAGGMTIDCDGVLEIHHAFMSDMKPDIFDFADYTALGHFHVPHNITPNVRYSGSPMPFGFADAHIERTISIVSFDRKTPVITQEPVPVFRQMTMVKGALEEIKSALKGLAFQQEETWVSIECSEHVSLETLRKEVSHALKKSNVDVLSMKIARKDWEKKEDGVKSQTLGALSVLDVFKKRLALENIPSSEWPLWIEMHNEIVKSIEEDMEKGA
jgi:exonuclease SbcD